MNDIVRGVSIHTTSEGPQYYVHYDIKGTIMVNEQQYELAFMNSISGEQK
ncbi:hypothetical protein KHA80_15040 [Anaerobacillus sp. HL2]|nr:hypothetical protein KHA80_15040 [Anaerobacillus sp. HL2]